MHPRLAHVLCAAAVLAHAEAAAGGRARMDAPPAGMNNPQATADMPAPDYEHIPDDMQPRANAVEDLPPLDLARPVPHSMMAAGSLAVPDVDVAPDSEPQQKASQPMAAPEGLMPDPDKNHIPAAMLPPWLQPQDTP